MSMNIIIFITAYLVKLIFYNAGKGYFLEETMQLASYYNNTDLGRPKCLAQLGMC